MALATRPDSPEVRSVVALGQKQYEIVFRPDDPMIGSHDKPFYVRAFSGGIDDEAYRVLQTAVEKLPTDKHITQAFDHALATPTDIHGNTLLHIAASRGDIHTLLALHAAVHTSSPREWQSMVGQKNSDGDTALHCAAHNGSGVADKLQCMRYLLAWGADPNTPAEPGVQLRRMTPMHVAAASGWSEAVAEMAGKRGQLDRVDDAGHSPLSLAAWYGHLECVAVLLQLGASASLQRSVQPILEADDGSVMCVSAVEDAVVLHLQDTGVYIDAAIDTSVTEGAMNTPNRSSSSGNWFAGAEDAAPAEAAAPTAEEVAAAAECAEQTAHYYNMIKSMVVQGTSQVTGLCIDIY